jgi:hypothetical protein
MVAMPKLVRMYLTHVALGFALSALFTAALLWLDVGRLGHLVSHTAGGAVALVMLFMFNGIVFAGVQFAIAIMRLEGDDTQGGKPRRLALEPVVVRSGRR